ncbi:hypothetical protein DFH06DRAFT_1349460 [Mycena polygramma]|nr:hypothetical protein DFH06DRAFT_1349460 [Mycena polygramma]
MANTTDNPDLEDTKPKFVEKPPEQMDVDAPSGAASSTGGSSGPGEVSTDDTGSVVPDESRSPSQSDDELRRGRRSTMASGFSGPADVSARVPRPESLNTCHAWLSETRLKEQMREGSWNFHELLGAPICANVVERSEDVPYCEICLEYVEHVCNAIRDADLSIDAALKLRTLWLTVNNRTGDAARLEGEICAVRAMLRDRDEDLFRMNKECIKAIADRKAWCIEADKAWSVVKDFKRRNEKLAAELKDALSQIERMDGGRSRKTPHVESSKESAPKVDMRVDDGAGPAKRISTECGKPADSVKVKIFPNGMPVDHAVNTTNVLSGHAPTDEDITMEEVRHKNIIVNWKDLRGLARMVVRWPYSGLPGQPPPKGTWAMKGFSFTVLEDYQAAHHFMHSRTCYPVGLTVFAEYWHARVAQQLKKELTAIQKWALEHFQMPLWLWDIFQTFNVDSIALAENRRFWQVAKCPAFDDSVHTWAAFIQRGGCPPDGLEFVDDFGTLEGRMIRGLMIWLQISYPRPKHTSSTRNRDVDESWSVARALMYMVLYPDSYGTILRLEHIDVASELKLENWCTHEPVTDDQVVRRFARMGLTVEMVHDMYPFVMRLAESVLNGSRVRKGWDKVELKAIVDGSKEHLAAHGLPPGISVPYGKFIPRPPGLPWPDSQMNKVQEKGVFLLDIPLLEKDGKVALVTMRPLPEQSTGKPAISTASTAPVLIPPAPIPVTPKPVNTNPVRRPDVDRRNTNVGGSRYNTRGSAPHGRGGYRQSPMRTGATPNAHASSSSRSSADRGVNRFGLYEAAPAPSASTSIYTSSHAPPNIHPNSMQSSIHAPAFAHSAHSYHPASAPHPPHPEFNQLSPPPGRQSAFPPQATFFTANAPLNAHAPNHVAWHTGGQYPSAPAHAQYANPQQIQQPIQFGSTSMYSHGTASAFAQGMAGPSSATRGSSGMNFGQTQDDAHMEYSNPALHHHPL